jgi:uncharacterized protein YggE
MFPLLYFRRAGFFMLAALGCGVAVPAWAQTELDLSATGQVVVPPDEMTAALQVQASAASAVAAQAAVNQEMAKALALANATNGVVATTGGYNVAQTTPDGASTLQFQASQSLQLVMPAPKGAVPDSFTALVGALQQNGLLLNDLSGDLSTAGQRAAQSRAIADAIGQIQAQAGMVAGDLRVSIGAIKTLNVSVNAPGPIGRPMFAMARLAGPMPPPQSAPQDITVQASISAAIELGGAPSPGR